MLRDLEGGETQQKLRRPRGCSMWGLVQDQTSQTPLRERCPVQARSGRPWLQERTQLGYHVKTRSNSFHSTLAKHRSVRQGLSKSFENIETNQSKCTVLHRILRYTKKNWVKNAQLQNGHFEQRCNQLLCLLVERYELLPGRTSGAPASKVFWSFSRGSSSF